MASNNKNGILCNEGYIYVYSNPMFRNDWLVVGHSSEYNSDHSKVYPQEINQLLPVPFVVELVFRTDKYSDVDSVFKKYLYGFQHFNYFQDTKIFSMFNDNLYENLIGYIFEMQRNEGMIQCYNRITYPGINLNLHYELRQAIWNIYENDAIYDAEYSDYSPVPFINYKEPNNNEENEELEGLLNKLGEVRAFFQNTNAQISGEYDNRFVGAILRLWKSYLMHALKIEDPNPYR